MAIHREKIRLYSGVPRIVTVENLRGRECNSSLTGDEICFDVLNESTPSHLYLPRAWAAAVAASGAQAGDEIQVLKTGTNGQTPTYRVRLVSDAHLAVPVLPAQAQPIRMLAPRQQETPALAPQPGPALDYRPAPRPAAPPTAQTVPTSHPLQERMTRMFVVAAGSLRDAHQQLLADPFFGELEPPTWEDIRSLAVHWAISMERKAERR
jgi:hypothetical protein